MKKLGFIATLLAALILVPKNPAYATRASLLCDPASGTYNIGDNITLSYILDTRAFPVYGADIVATYTPSVFDVVGTQSTPVTSVTNWTAPVTNTVDANLGKIRLDYGQSQGAYTGSTAIGTITFKAKAAGQGQFNYTFFQQYDNTTIAGGASKAWGIMSAGAAVSNILTDVTNCIYVISGAGPTSPPSTPAPTTPVVTSLPRSGTGEVTIGLLALAAVFITGGMIVPLAFSKKY